MIASVYSVLVSSNTDQINDLRLRALVSPILLLVVGRKHFQRSSRVHWYKRYKLVLGNNALCNSLVAKGLKLVVSSTGEVVPGK